MLNSNAIVPGSDYEQYKKHDLLTKEVLDYMISHYEDDPIELLSRFAEKIRVLLDCDQVIYRDLAETRIMVNSPAIEGTWSVPVEYCQQCQHFDAHHPMYAGGYTEMDNCQKGWQGIPVYHKCPIKSSLTRIVYCNGEVAGYFAIHYVQKYHSFTDFERETLEEFVRNLSLTLSRYESNRKLKELKLKEEQQTRELVQHTQRIMILEDNLESVYDVDLESCKYVEYVKGSFYQQNITDKLVREGNFFDDLKDNINTVIYSEDREGLFNVLSKESLVKALSENDRIEYFYRIMVGSTPVWFKIRVVYKDAEKKSLIIGAFNASEELETRQIVEQRKKIEENQKRLSHDMELISALSENFIAVDYVELNQNKSVDKVMEYRVSDELLRMVPEWKGESSFTKKLDLLYDKFLYDPDKEQFISDTRREKILAKLASSNTCYVNFRSLIEGEIRYYQMQFSAVRENGQLTGIVAGLQSIDEQLKKEKKLQLQLENALDDAVQANKAKSSFLFNMSHDIRTPLNAINGFTAMAKKNLDDKDKTTDYLNKIDLAGQQLLMLINQVLEMSRIESGKIEFVEKPVNVRESFYLNSARKFDNGRMNVSDGYCFGQTC